MLPIFFNIFTTFARCFKRDFLYYQILACAITFVIVTSNLDWIYFQSTRSTILRSLIFPAIALGGLVPIVAPLLLLAYGTIRKKEYMKNTAWGLGQAAMLGLIISSTYKAFTGRIPPSMSDTVLEAINTSHGFQFGFMEGGVFWGWPSSHTTIAFAMAATVATLFPSIKKLKYMMFIYATYVAFGVSVSIHWLSEAVAGIIIGTVIGLAVGKSYFRRYQSERITNDAKIIE